MLNWLKRILFTSTGTPHTTTLPATSSLAHTALLAESEACKKSGDTCFGEGKLDEAIECYRQAIALNPDFVRAYNNLSNALREQKQFKEAENCLNRAILIDPKMVYSYYNLASLLYEEGRLPEALQHFNKVIEIQPDFPEAHNYMGILFEKLGKVTESVTSFRLALKYNPEHYTAKMQLTHLLQQLCEWKGVEENIRSVRLAALTIPPNEYNRVPAFASLSWPGTTASEQKLFAMRYSLIRYQPFSSLRRKLDFKFNRATVGKINIGYLSADFRQHPVSYLMAEVFELHDRNRFHLTAYSYGPDDGSALRKRIEIAFDNFVDIQNDTYEIAAKKIYADHTDILVDLTGHTQNSRSGILALRPAPVQVNYLGYPGTMGADFVDYLIADRFTIPPEMQQHYTEKVIWMPDCFQANDRKRPKPSSPNRKDCGLPENGFVFCCFNQTFKITPEIFEVWCRLLKTVPGSILWLPASNPQAEGNLRREAESRGVDAERIIMAPLLHRDDHLARLQSADLFLDTLPFNAGTTCSDALWMGLPVVTCAGDAFASRMAGSLLTAIGVPELITYNLQDYYNLAFDLATDQKKLAIIRNKIIANRDTTALFDSERFTRNLEQVYTKMISESGLMPASN